MSEDTFTCSHCGETFIKELTDDEALTQLAKEFPGWDVNACNLVCNDCFYEINPDKKSEEDNERPD